MEERDRPLESGDAFSAALSSLFSDPEMMATVSSLAERLKGDKDSKGGSVSEPSGDVSAALGSLAPRLLASAAGSEEDERRACLLRALKPYLSQSRCDAIDRMISILRVSNLFKGADGR